ncbi:TPA: ImmA/IrrE family metallo-endopeptidase, partial [Legionella pneumophila]|nr:ImmA/IrrE family metallo-endopeptidase [Legionella pneumophila]
LTWARERAGLTEDLLAERMHVTVEKIISWEEEKNKPTFTQAQKIAQITHIPFGYFFLENPPIEKLPIPDLRTVGSTKIQEPSLDLLDMIKQVILKQEWYKDYLISQDAKPLPFVGRFNTNSSIYKVAEDIRKVLEVPIPQKGTWEEYQKNLFEGAEAANILVMCSGVVGSNNHRKLSVNEFRGFAITDPIAPLVFINNSDAPTAKLFTLIHELTHIWIGSSGISDLNNHNKVESFCNKVAGEFLVPKEEIQSIWKPNNELLINLTEISSKFHVSKLVVAKRAVDLN